MSRSGDGAFKNSLISLRKLISDHTGHVHLFHATPCAFRQDGPSGSLYPEGCGRAPNRVLIKAHFCEAKYKKQWGCSSPTSLRSQLNNPLNSYGMQCEQKESVKSETPYKDFIEAAKTIPLRYDSPFHDHNTSERHLSLSYRVRAPCVPGPNRYAPAWEVPDELAMPRTPRALKRIYSFEDLGQDLAFSCYRCQ